MATLLPAGQGTDVAERTQDAATAISAWACEVRFSRVVAGLACRVKVALPTEHVGNDQANRLKPGMVVEPELLSDRRKVYQWFLDPSVSADQRGQVIRPLPSNTNQDYFQSTLFMRTK